MATSSENSDRELFRPKPDWSPGLVGAYLLVFTCLAREIIPFVLVGTVIAFSVYAGRDMLTAYWLSERDPHRGRGRASFWFCLSRAALKIVVVSASAACVVYNPFGWHSAINWQLPVILFAGIAAHVALAIVGRCLARGSGVRVWIDSGLHRSRKEDIWPPRCRGAANEVGSIWLTALASFAVVFVLGLDTLAHAPTDFELPIGFALIAIMLGGIVWSRQVMATTPEECWYMQMNR